MAENQSESVKMNERLQSKHIIKEALFTDGTSNFRMPLEAEVGQSVCFLFQTARGNVDGVHMIHNNDDVPMTLVTQTEYFDIYEVHRNITIEWNQYYFYITKNQENEQPEIYYYLATGPETSYSAENQFYFQAGFKTPDWAKGAVMYQIFPDRFYNGDTSNDVHNNEYLYLGEGTVEVNRWQKYPSSVGIREFYGGDLLGIMKKLDYLQELGVEVIYLNPIFVSPSNHKYDIQDYDYVDPHFGCIVNDCSSPIEQIHTNEKALQYIKRVTDVANLNASNELFIQLVEEIHRKGMRIILDGVFNHCGSFHKWLDREGIYRNADGYEKGAYQNENSPYRSFFRFRHQKWPYNSSYEGWWGHETLPKLNYEDSQTLYDYIMDVAKKWVEPPYNADGWRLDVAADLGHSEQFNHQFWRDFRKSVKLANPEAIILAEHYGDASAWLKGDQWDSVMNYDAFMEPITWFLTGMEKHSDEYRPELVGNFDYFSQCMGRNMAKFQTSSLLTAMNELSNHDHSRFLTRTNHMVGRIESLGPQAAADNINYGVFRTGVVIQFTWIGSPTIYYGDEAGVCGWTDPDNRRTYPWGDEDKSLILLHKELISIHKSYEALQTGSLKILCGEKDVLVYGRMDRTDRFIIAVNISSTTKQISIPVWQIGMLDSEKLVQLIETSQEGHSREAEFLEQEHGDLLLQMKPNSARVIKNYVPYN